MPNAANHYATPPTEFTRPLSINGISIGSPVLQSSQETETHKDHATPSVAISRIYAMHAMRPKTEFIITHDRLVLQTNRHSRLRHHRGISVGHSGLCSDISSRPMNCRLQNHK